MFNRKSVYQKIFVGSLKPLIAIALLFWSLISAPAIYNEVRKIMNSGGYQAATFVVSDAKYERVTVGVGSRQRVWDTYEAIGAINGVKESMALNYLDTNLPKSTAELRKLVPSGTKIHVLYNPNMPKVHFQGESWRVLPYTENLNKDAVIRIGKCILVFWAPLFVFVFLTKKANRAMGSGLN